MDLDVLDGLKQLNYPLDENGLKKAVADGPLSREYTKCVEWLSKEIKHFYNLDEHVNAISSPDDTFSFLLELSSFLKELGCLYKSLTEGNAEERLKSRNDRLKLLDFLINELFGARILSVRKPTTQNLKITINESPTAANLKKMLMALSFPKPPANITSGVMFTKVNTKVQEISNVLVSPPLFTGKLTDKQWVLLEKVNKDLQEEYENRRKMLLKRLDVTIQSFQWSERMKGKENDIAEKYSSRRNNLTAATSVKLSDLIAARAHLAVLEKTSSASVRKNTQSSINKVIIGRVPDRGGRPEDQQPPPPEMPSWAPRANQPQGGGGYQGGGGGRGGGRGGGGDRGGRVQGGWNQGGGGGYQGDRGGYQGDRGGGGYQGDRGGYHGDRDRGYQGDRDRGGTYQGDGGYQGGGASGHYQDRGGHGGSYHNDRGGYHHDRGSYHSDRGGYQNDRSVANYQNDRSVGGYQNDRSGGGYQNDRGGSGYQERGGLQGSRGNISYSMLVVQSLCASFHHEK
ncbi:hypothetical protein GE061_005362 [Apolygus lucorum]|uniref:Protein FAM98A n=1 Tax=Apolygus lucorum TaxID=248454 RepID=A0A8S9X010_APOLU|nr:hypothetical protein GE061_005362 [Apolygus lucorum]